jgi:O-antigen/teichoic acid export membrane protein
MTETARREEPRKTELLGWNLANVGTQAVAGLALNLLVGAHYGAAGVGVFGQLVTLQILFSQLGVFGFQNAASRFVSLAPNRPARRSQVFWSCLAGSLLGGTVVAAIGWLSIPWIASLWKSPDVATAWQAALPGLALYCANKTLVSFLNGSGRYRAFSALGALRFPLWCLFTAVAAEQWPMGLALGLAVSATETVLFVVAMVVAWPDTREWKGRFFPWLRRAGFFGAKSFPAAALVELNTRIDILVLGAFASDATVGQYTFAAFFVEGAFQVIVAVRNAMQSRLVAWARAGVFWLETRDFRKWSMVLSAVAATASLLAIPLTAHLWLPGGEFGLVLPLATIMLVGLVLSARDQSLGLALVQLGHPGLQTRTLALQVLATLALNGMLIPPLGVVGAALATGAAFVVGGRIIVLMLGRLVPDVVRVA